MPHHNHKNHIQGIVATLLLLGGFCLFPVTSYAATLSIAPSAAKVTVGNIVSVKVLVATQGKSINNSESVIQFPADLLEVMSLNKSSSIFTLWVEEPKFSSTEGKITYNGGVPSPGYVGESGEILSITFRAKKSGTASIVLSDSTVRQNDGLGTNILTAKQGGVIVIDSSAQLEVPAVNTSANTIPAKPVITSSTHPDQDAWYSGNSASFSWIVPNDVTSLQTLLGKSSNSTPTVPYDSSVSQRTVNNLTDGVFYFHLRYMNSVGWSPVAHYKIQVDSTPPEKFSIKVQDEGARSVVTLAARDVLSGVESYGVQIDDASAIRVKESTLVDGKYVLPVQREGEHRLSVIAYDRAGNHSQAEASFLSIKIAPPSIKIIPDYITKGETARVDGTTDYAGSNALVFIQPEDGDARVYTTITDDEGSFSVTTDEFGSSGLVTVWSQLVFSDSVQSPMSDKITVRINDTKLVKTTKSISYTLSALIILLILLLALLYITYLGWHKFFGLKRKLARDLNATVGDIHKAMMMFKEELSRQLAVLEKIKEDRALNKKEEKIFKELRDTIDDIDGFIEKKLRKIK